MWGEGAYWWRKSHKGEKSYRASQGQTSLALPKPGGLSEGKMKVPSISPKSSLGEKSRGRQGVSRQGCEETLGKETHLAKAMAKSEGDGFI